ncbi:hypothetical protein [Actinokineospora enzanensis]|uniref:hypothetical protein n=1 Tax=Actinokineospora enzanensis TaxID=155975 RepID=UPI0003781312|nr:hypothetical protein [Actinokineospora enzanensis]
MATSNAPTRKVGAGAAVGAITVVLVWIAGSLGVEIPADVAAAVTVLLSFAASYLVPENEL